MERPAWDRIQEIYHLTLPMPQSERSAFIATACDDDPLLMREVKSLLKADDSLGGFMDTSVFELGLKVISSNSANESADSLIGTTIENKFLVERVLGQGGMGKVYLAHDLTLHRKAVVIKVLLDASVKDRYVVKKFRQEVEALARIAHPNVVSVLGANELPDGTPYIVMQHVKGVTLRSQIPVEGMDLERAAQILKQVGAALEYVHQEKIFHRDLKPDNIMLQSLNDVEHVTVVDFGIAKVKDSVVASSTSDKVSVGTVLYMSPEQLRGGPITAASDTYSMGVMAYEMVTGRRPFKPSSSPQLLEMQREGVRVKPIDLRPGLSTAAQASILRSLSFEPGERYQSAAEFGDTLARALFNEAAPAPESADNTPDRQLRPGKLQFAIIGGFLVLLLGILVVVWFIKQTPKNANVVSSSTPTETPSLPAHSFIYSLTVQRMRNRRAFQAAFQSTGQDIFDTGDKFQLNVMSNNSGYVYVFNEGTPEPNVSSFTIIYPIPSVNNGSASVGANQWARTNWNTFGGEPGTENLWIVWSTAAVPQLESGKSEAFNNNGRLTGQSLDAVKAFLTTKKEESNSKINRDKATQQTTVRGVGDVVVRMLELQHR